MAAMQQLELKWFIYSKWTFIFDHPALSCICNLPDRFDVIPEFVT